MYFFYISVLFLAFFAHIFHGFRQLATYIGTSNANLFQQETGRKT